jgi:hypothetical protein
MGKHDEEDEGFVVGEVEYIHHTKDAKGGILSCKFRMLEKTNFLEIGEEFWVPFSQLHDNSDIYRKGEKGELTVKTWWAKKEGWADS